MTITITLAGEPRELEAHALESSTSKSTARQIRNVRLEFVAGTGLRDQIDDDLRAGQENPLEDADGELWKVSTWSSLRRDAGEQVEYDVELQQVEQIDVSRVVFLGLDVAAESYNEDITGDDFSFTVMFTTRGDEIRTFEQGFLNQLRGEADQ